MKAPKEILAAAIAEATELCSPEGFYGSLALRRLSEAGYEIRPLTGLDPKSVDERNARERAAVEELGLVYGSEDLDRWGFLRPRLPTRPRTSR